MEGTKSQFADRGLLPRCLAYIYGKLEEKKENNVKLDVT